MTATNIISKATTTTNAKSTVNTVATFSITAKTVKLNKKSLNESCLLKWHGLVVISTEQNRVILDLTYVIIKHPVYFHWFVPIIFIFIVIFFRRCFGKFENGAQNSIVFNVTQMMQ